MICKKNIVIATVVAALSGGFWFAANADTANNLMQMDVKRSSVADSVDVTFYTTGNSTNSVVTRKSNNRYVVLLPNVSGSSSVTPGIGGVKDLVSNIDVKHVDDGIGGYMKVTFETTKPINIKTYIKKTAPLTQAQKDYKALISKNIKPAVQTTAQSKNTTVKPIVSSPSSSAKQVAKTAEKTAVKPVSQAKPTVNSRSESNTLHKTEVPQKTISLPKISLVPVTPSKAKTEALKPKTETKRKTEPVKSQKPIQIAQQPKVVDSAVHPVDNYVPKMKFDANGKRQIDLEPRVTHKILKEAPNQAKVDDTFAIPENNSVSAQPVQGNTVTENSAKQNPALDVPQSDNSNHHHFPVWIALAGGVALGVFVMFLIYDAVSHSSQKNSDRLNSFFKLSSKNQARRRRREYQDIIDDENLNWQEKYKKYTEKDRKLHSVEKSNDLSYVTDMSATKKAIISPVEENTMKSVPVLKSSSVTGSIKNIPPKENNIREQLRARVSQMEHSLAQTPSVNPPEDVPSGVRSEDDSIMNTFSDIKLKSFAKSGTLKQTNRSLLEDEDKRQLRNKSLKEGRFVKLKNSPLNVNRRKSASSEVGNIMNTENSYLSNNGEMKMDRQNENYSLSSLNEYLSLLDSEDAKTPSSAVVAETLSHVKSSSGITNKSGVTNPISRGANPMAKSKSQEPTPYMNGLIVKSGYNIDAEKGFYLVNMDGVSALVGRIKDDIFILKKFNYVVDKPLQVRQDYGSVYIVKAGGFKCLVDVAKDKMGTLIEI